MRIFLDVVGFYRDFPQAAAFTDVLGHSANSMCSMCFIRRRKGQNVPETNFSVETHSGRAGYIRFDARRQAIRASHPHSSVLRALGMEYSNSVDTNELPAERCSSIISEAKSSNCVISVYNTPVVPL